MDEISMKIKVMTEKISLVDFVNNYFKLGDKWLEEQNLTEEELNFWARTINNVDEWGEEYVNLINKSHDYTPETPVWKLTGYKSEEDFMTWGPPSTDEDYDWKEEADEEIKIFMDILQYCIECRALDEEDIYSVGSFFSFLNSLDELQKDLVIRELEIKISTEQWKSLQ